MNAPGRLDELSPVILPFTNSAEGERRGSTERFSLDHDPSGRHFGRETFTPTCSRQTPILDSLQNPTGNYTCTVTDTVGTWEEPNYVPTNVAHAIDPQGRFAIAYIGVWNMVRSLATTWSTCPDSGSNPHPDQCKLRTADSVLTSRVVAWTVTRGGAWSALSLPSVAASTAELWGMAIGESGRELMVQVGRFVWDRRNGGSACTATRHEWIDLQTSPGSMLYTRPVADEQLCDGGYSSEAMGAALRNQPAGKNSLRKPPGR